MKRRSRATFGALLIIQPLLSAGRLAYSCLITANLVVPSDECFPWKPDKRRSRVTVTLDSRDQGALRSSES